MSILSDKTFLFDIETSGLHRERDHIISIGVLYLQDDKIQKTHFFIDNLEQEKEVLTGFITWCQSYESIVTYRGKGFDYPFLLTRLKYHQLSDFSFLKLKLIDIEKVLKLFGKTRHELETKLQISRHASSTGKDVAKLYKTYLSAPDQRYKKLILMHQVDELDSLYGLWELYQMLYHLKSTPIHEHFVNNNELTIIFTTNKPFSYSFNEKILDVHFIYHKGSSTIEVNCPLYHTQLMHELNPVKDYYYVESHKQLIHKSLASFIPPSLKRKAKKEECVVYDTHTFLRIYSSHQLKEQIWFDTDKNSYIIYQDKCPHIVGQQIFALFFQNNKSADLIPH